jgi:hypothetical protein
MALEFILKYVWQQHPLEQRFNPLFFLFSVDFSLSLPHSYTVAMETLSQLIKKNG